MTAPHRDVHSTVPTDRDIWCLRGLDEQWHFAGNIEELAPGDPRIRFTFLCRAQHGVVHVGFVRLYRGDFPLCALCGFEYERFSMGDDDAC